MTSIRSFIAIELSDPARQVLADLQERLKGVVPARSVRWTRPQNIHLTLHFLGNITPNDVAKVTEILQTGVPAYRPFPLRLEGLGCFPNMRRPRIVWVGVSGQIETLVKIHRELGQALNAIDFRPESRPYSPHLTIGRVKKGLRSGQVAQVSQALEAERPKIAQLIALEVGEISLMKSDLKPGGAVYAQLARGVLQEM